MRVVMARAVAGGLLAGSWLGGCGGDGDLDEAVRDGGAAEATAPTLAPAEDDESDGGATDDVATDIPEHFPLEVAPGGEVQGVFEPTEGSLQDFWMVRVLYPEDDAEDVVAFYDDLLDDLGFLDQKLASRPDRVRWMTTADAGIVTMKVETGDRFFPGSAILEISWNEL